MVNHTQETPSILPHHTLSTASYKSTNHHLNEVWGLLFQTYLLVMTGPDHNGKKTNISSALSLKTFSPANHKVLGFHDLAE